MCNYPCLVFKGPTFNFCGLIILSKKQFLSSFRLLCPFTEITELAAHIVQGTVRIFVDLIIDSSTFFKGAK